MQSFKSCCIRNFPGYKIKLKIIEKSCFDTKMLSQVTYSKSSTVDLGDTCRLLRKCQTLTAKLKVINVGT